MNNGYRVGLAVGLNLFACVIAQAELLRTVALSNQQVPGAPSGVVFNKLAIPKLNAAGQVAFGADLKGTAVNSKNNSGVLSEGSGPLALVARTGDQAPGLPVETVFSRFDHVTLGSSGHVAFMGGVAGDDIVSGNNGNGYGVWFGNAGSLEMRVRGGVQSPGGPSGVDLHFDDELLSIHPAGHMAVLARIDGAGVDISSDEVIWADMPSGVGIVAREGDQAPGMPNGVKFEFLGEPALNSTGQIAFDGSMSGRGHGPGTDRGIWTGTPGSLALVASVGGQAPGTPSGVTFDWVGWDTPILNAAGQTAFSGTLTGPGVDATNYSGIWYGNAGALSLVARDGEPAPGFPAGVHLGDMFDPVLNGAGQMAFPARLQGDGIDNSNNSAIWSVDSGSMSLVAREGDVAPGTDGRKFGDLIVHFVINSNGQTAFMNNLQDAVGSPPDRGIWAEDREGTLRLIARKGSELEVAPGDFRTVLRLDFASFSGSDEGQFNSFNERGQLAFWALFTDGSEGIFVSNVAAIPESGSLMIVAGAMVVLLPRRNGNPYSRRHRG